MKPSLLAFVLVTIFAATCSLQAERSKPKNTGPSSEDPSNKDAIHLVARSPVDLKQIFTYFPYPRMGASPLAENDRRPQRRARSLARSSRPGRVPEGPADTARHACLAQTKWV